MSLKKLKWGLRWQYSVIFIVLILISIISVSYTIIFAQRSDKAMIDDKKERLSIQAKQLATTMGKAFETGKNEETIINQFMAAAEKENKNYPWVITNLYLPDKGMISSYGQLRGARDYHPLDKGISSQIEPIINKVISTKKAAFVTDEGRFGLVISNFQPAIVDGKVKAVILVGERTPQDFSAFRNIRRIIFLLIVFGTFLGMIAMFYTTNKLVKGFNQIKKGLAMMEDNLHFRLPSQKGELGEIVTAINKMGDSLLEKEQLEQHVQRSERLASLGRLVAGVAHEIRNPLGIIKTSIQIMAKDNEKNEELKEYLDVMNEQVERQNRIIQELLDYAKPVKPMFQPVAVNQLVNSVLTLSKKYIQEHKVDIALELDESNPIVTGDGEKLKQVFINLIFNAVQAMPNGGKLSIYSGTEEQEVFIKFADTGEGIELNNLNKLFDPFFTTRDKGTGLGLAIVHQIVELHGGNIEVKSGQGNGALFSIKLPKEAEGEV